MVAMGYGGATGSASKGDDDDVDDIFQHLQLNNDESDEVVRGE
jgi:hypothetical protein